MNKDFIIKTEQEKTIELMSQILDMGQEVDARIKNTIKEIGMEAFLFNIDALDFPDEMKEKVNALKEIVQMNDTYGKAFYSVERSKRDDK